LLILKRIQIHNTILTTGNQNKSRPVLIHVRINTTCNVHFRKLERRANMTAAEATQSGDATVNDVNGPYYLG